MAAKTKQAASMVLLVQAEIGPAPVLHKGDVGPIVQSSSFQLPVIDLETQGFDQVQWGLGGGAGASDIARIGGISGSTRTICGIDSGGGGVKRCAS